ncbi:TPA: hypothetical protein ACF5B0_004686 [Vibrio parahaemolyticus]|uniref:hypothetical protein n=1 Tax=Vibrio parahaemolyticus TaxID=670 RepID=UPI001A1A9EFA|nr:hypothetical protein [Vibrio parahaemolyticus]EJB8544229.1 hypothetical protein [Vibrio parahaemolyticus]UPR37734.1 hypothetical protein H9K57_09400 [Vibrio parahaemolyticus]HAS6505941.1 hypothetical protein [Vibrio parahaemolyticus]HBC3560293.1 hypothetical protein [Vibrio parahaemolyticus]HBC3903204.1 hypothetical protein [Vibrio parahaemolyticus]
MSQKVRIYPHQTLQSLALVNHELLTDKLTAGDEADLDYYCINSIVSLAFSVEAILNFVGGKKVSGWKERQNWHQKLDKIYKAINEPLDFETEPLMSILKLKDIRNEIAHSKPVEVVKSASNHTEAKLNMKAEWELLLDPSFALHAYEQVDTFYHYLLQKFGISVFETLTSSIGTIDSKT